MSENELDGSFGMLLVPRVLLETESAGFGLTARGTRLAADLRPRRSASRELRKIGLKLESLDARPGREPKSKSSAGVFSNLGAFGVTAAFFKNNKAHERAVDALDADYVLIRDFRLGITRPVATDAAQPRSAKSAKWPAQANLANALKKGNRGQGAVVAVLDTGVDADHEEFADQTIPFTFVSFHPYDRNWGVRHVRGFDTHGHGTHVSGIVAGRRCGVAPGAQLVGSAVIESERVMTSFMRVIYALQAFLQELAQPRYRDKMAIVNMSLGFDPAALDAADRDAQLGLMKRVVAQLLAANVLPIVAAGNDESRPIGYPGRFAEALTVGAVDFRGRVAKFTSTGAADSGSILKPEIWGYGVDVPSAFERSVDGRHLYRSLTGTSMASPYVTGIAALIATANPTYTAAQVKDALIENALDLGGGARLARFPEAGFAARRTVSTSRKKLPKAAKRS